MNSQAKTFSLRVRLTVLLAVAVFVTLGSAARIIDWRADAEMQHRFDASLLARAESLASLVQFEDDRIEVDAEDAATAVFPGNASRNWYDLQCAGRVIARTAAVPPVAPGSGSPVFSDARAGGRSLRTVTLHFSVRTDADTDAVAGRGASAPCVLHYALDRGPLDDILGTLDLILLASLLGACALVMALSPWLVQRGLRPLVMLGQAMADIGPDSPGRRLPESGTAELRPLVARFNAVLERMDGGLSRERQFASGLAHEFRTRLAELRALVDVETQFPRGDAMPGVLAEVGTIGAELEGTVVALLRLTRLQSGLEDVRPESTLLAPLLDRVGARHRDAAHARGVEIRHAPAAPADAVVAADPRLLEVILDNLVGNAVAYAPAGTTVEFGWHDDIVYVRNAAPTLRADDLANFGERFWRKGEPGMGHAGLGLALANAAAHAMHMRLAFELKRGVLLAKLVMGPSFQATGAAS